MCSLGLYFIHNEVILKVTFSLNLSLTLESLFDLQFEWYCLPFNETGYEFTRFIWFCSDKIWCNEKYEQTLKVQVRQIQNWGWNSPVRVNVLTWRGERCTLKALLSQFCAHFIHRECQWCYILFKVIFSLKCIVIVDESFSILGVLSRGSFPFLIWYASCHKRGFRNLVFPMWFILLGGSFVFFWMWVLLLCSLYSPPLFFLVLWFSYDWQGFITPGERRVLWKTRFWKEKKRGIIIIITCLK